VRLANGREASALQIQTEYLERALRYAERRDLNPEEKQALMMWEHCLTQLDADPSGLDQQVDWIIKRRLIEAYQDRHGYGLEAPEVAMVDLQYHDIHQDRSLFHRLQRRGLVERMVTDDAINTAIDQPPQTTRARLRGEFIRKAKAANRDFTVDWVHLKLNDQAQRTVLCKDPFRHTDERVERLIASL
jgi:proteasome accessory factor A